MDYYTREEIELGIILLTVAVAIYPPRTIRLRKVTSLFVGVVGFGVATHGILLIMGMSQGGRSIYLMVFGIVSLVMAVRLWQHPYFGLPPPENPAPVE